MYVPYSAAMQLGPRDSSPPSSPSDPPSSEELPELLPEELPELPPEELPEPLPEELPEPPPDELPEASSPPSSMLASSPEGAPLFLLLELHAAITHAMASPESP